MGSDWCDKALGDISNFKNGKGLNNTLYTDDGRFPVWGANGVIAHTNVLLNEEPVVVIGRVGAYCGSVHAVQGPNWVTDNAIFATPKDGYDFLFLYYLLKFIKPERTSIGSAQPLITQAGLKTLICHVPEKEAEQRAIAHILVSLDDKIELNQKMNETLETIARTIFKSWFVEFDPVRAKAEGRDPGLPKEITDLFPDSFEDSELEEIPKGWEVKQIGDEVEFAYGKALKASNRMPGNIPVYGSNGPVGLHNKALVKGPGIVIGRKGNPGTVTWSSRDFFPIDTTFYVKSKERISSLFYVFYAF
ncbi:MAG: restriction endonuclease subunit S [Deltaproteobacteria bacterium]|nr:restriction endonuclease subunit S [Deltaproteobacteria bacterium]